MRLGRTLAAATAAVAVAATWLVARPEDHAHPGNLAFVDMTLTDQVTAAVHDVVPRVFSIDARAVRRAERLVDEHLTGRAVEQYDELYADFLAAARRQGVSLTTRVRTVGLSWLHEDEARVLVLADQVGTARDGQTASGASQVSLLLQREGSAWRISEIAVL